VYVLTGIPGGDGCLQIAGAELVRQLVLDNQVMLGSVNAARGHFQMGVDHLRQAHWKWGALCDRLVTHRFTPEEFIASHHHKPDAIKQVVEWMAAESQA
jgi:glucose 1-dehydrogenase